MKWLWEAIMLLYVKIPLLFIGILLAGFVLGSVTDCDQVESNLISSLNNLEDNINATTERIRQSDYAKE